MNNDNYINEFNKETTRRDNTNIQNFVFQNVFLGSKRGCNFVQGYNDWLKYKA